jgi:dGTP triphosphohydrolase
LARDNDDLQLLLPQDRYEEYKNHQDARRAIADHIASLTERDASALYGRLSGLRMGAITDAL